MFVTFAKVLLIFVCAKRVVDAQHSQRPYQLKKEYLNKRLAGYSLFETKVFDHTQCAYVCMFFSICESINYAIYDKMCELNSEGSETVNSADFIEDKGTVYSDITDWPKAIASGCQNHNCEDHEQCWPLGNDAFKCVDINCEEPPTVTNAVVAPGSRLAGSNRTYMFTCPEPFYLVGNTDIKCRYNRSWTALEARCKRLQSCADLKECNYGYTDGEYWLNPELFGEEKLKVYCHGMDSESPEEFITLIEAKNYGYYSGSADGVSRSSSHNYGKIRLDLKTMVIDNSRYEFTVSNPADVGLRFGHAAGCMCSCADGYFQIDSAGTGLKFGTTIQWHYNTLGTLENFYRSTDGTVISANCGGLCGECWPSPNLYVELDQTQYIPDAEATFPVCVSP